MENRSDLADILFAGLPAEEAQHVRQTIQQSDKQLLARKRAGLDPADQNVVDLSAAEDDEADEGSLVS